MIGKCIQIISYHLSLLYQSYLGKSLGLPCQRILKHGGRASALGSTVFLSIVRSKLWRIIASDLFSVRSHGASSRTCHHATLCQHLLGCASHADMQYISMDPRVKRDIWPFASPKPCKHCSWPSTKAPCMACLSPFQALPLRRTQRFFLARLIDRLGNFILICSHTKEKACLDKAGQERDVWPKIGLCLLCHGPVRKTIGKRP